MNKFDLTGEYFEAYQNIKLSARTYSLSGEKYKEAMQNLLDVLYTAQQNNRPVETIIGYDDNKFASEYFSEYTVKDYGKEFFSDLTMFMVILCIVVAIDFWNGKTQVNIRFMMFSAVVYMILRFIGYLRKKVGYQKHYFLSTCIGVFIVSFLIKEDMYVDIVYPLMVCGVWIVVYGSRRVSKRYRRK